MRFFLSKTKKSLSENDQSLIKNASYGDLEEVRDLLRAGANVNAQRDDGTTALYIASQVGSANVVRELLQNDKVDVNLQRSDGSTALYIASKKNHEEVVRLLLQNNKVDANLKCTDGSTAHRMACSKGHIAIASLLRVHLEGTVGSSSTLSSDYAMIPDAFCLMAGIHDLITHAKNGRLDNVRDLSLCYL
ncbi:hypothetical protein MHU86_11256 [Fragilaria crotonensis]|nr:hypothetical protein MHU86_11256 [Fragilaria crotonensis]